MIPVFLDLIYISFPILCYFIYVVYNKVKYEREKIIFLDLALLSSYYICTKFGNLNHTNVFLIYIPILISVYKKRNISTFFLTVFTINFLYNIYNINLVYIILEFLIIYVVCSFGKIKTDTVFTFINIIFNLFITFVLKADVVDNYQMILALKLILIPLIYKLSLVYYIKTENIINMYNSLANITKEKKLYESLFKITHEIKNPLAVCKGYLDMFDPNDSKKVRRYVGIINQEIDRTLLLLRDFSDVSKLNIEKDSIDIVMLLEDVCDEAKMILNNNISFSYVLPKKEIYMNGDYNRLKQVFINVIKNAKESIKEKGKVRLEAKLDKNKIYISVKDTGIGMDKETKKNIGKAFYTTKKNGTGLGVCFSKDIIDKHGGTIEYFSKENVGTTVKIRLNINKASN